MRSYHETFPARNFNSAGAAQFSPGRATLAQNSRNSLRQNGALFRNASPKERLKAAMVDILMVIDETRPEIARRLGRGILRVWPSFKEL